MSRKSKSRTNKTDVKTDVETRAVNKSPANKLQNVSSNSGLNRDHEEINYEWSAGKRLWVSLILLAHIFCIALAPLATVEPRSNLSLEVHRLVRPYTQVTFLEHGYRFFAPEPGPGHLVLYEVTDKNGKLITGQFPDRDEMWPRLIYHRWFMLSETVFQHLSQTLDPDELEKWKVEIKKEIEDTAKQNPRFADWLEYQYQQELSQHQRLEQLRDRLVADIGQVLMKRHNGTSVTMKLVTRLIPMPQDVARGVKLDDPRYLPEDAQFDLGTINLGSHVLESIEPQESK